MGYPDIFHRGFTKAETPDPDAESGTDASTERKFTAGVEFIKKGLKEFTSLDELATAFAALGDAVITGSDNIRVPAERTDDYRERLRWARDMDNLNSKFMPAAEVARLLRDYAGALSSAKTDLANRLLASLPVAAEDLDDPERDLQMVAEALGERMLSPYIIDFSDIAPEEIQTRSDAFEDYEKIVKRIKEANPKDFLRVYKVTKEDYLYDLDNLLFYAKSPTAHITKSDTGEEIRVSLHEITRKGGLRPAMQRILEVIRDTNEER